MLLYFILGILFIPVFDGFCRPYSRLIELIVSYLNAKIAKNNNTIAELSDKDELVAPIGFAIQEEDEIYE